MNEQQRKQSANALIATGLLLGGIPLACLIVLVISTGHAVQPGGETSFFGLVYLGFASGICLVPLGLILVIAGIVRHMSKPKRPG